MNSCSKCGGEKKVFRLPNVSSSPICQCSCSCDPCNCFDQPQEVPRTETTGAIWKNPATAKIITTLLNKTSVPQTVTVSVVDWQNCDRTEMEKESFLCDEPINPLLNGPIPLTFTIPANKLLVVHATPYASQPLHSFYEVLVTYPPVPITPGDPIRPVIANTWGINAARIPQVGNTVLHHQFSLHPGDPV